MNTKEKIYFAICIISLAAIFFFMGCIFQDIKNTKERIAENKNCCSTYGLCQNSLNAIKGMKDYQIELTNDSIMVFDGDRKVGTALWGDKDNHSEIEDIFLEDNL